MVGRVKWVLDGDGYPNGWRGEDGISTNPSGRGRGKKLYLPRGWGWELIYQMGMGMVTPIPTPPRPVCIPIYNDGLGWECVLMRMMMGI